MIAHLRGRLLSKAPQQAIVEAAGVGYDVAITIPTFTSLPAEGTEVALVIYTHVREDQIALYGFLEPVEKRLFEKLLTISGIGPKLAITILSGLDVERLVSAIRGQDHALLTRIPGVGRKTAERVVLELKDKLDEMAASAPGPSSVTGAVAENVLSALLNLGYQRPVAQRAIDAAVQKDASARQSFETLFRGAMAAMR